MFTFECSSYLITHCTYWTHRTYYCTRVRTLESLLEGTSYSHTTHSTITSLNMSKSKSKTQEALAFLDDLDKLGADGDTANPSVAASATAASDDRKKRSSVEVNKPLKSGAQTGGKAGGNNNSKAEKTESGDKDGKTTAEDPEAALAFLQAQIDQKRPVSRTQNAPLSRPTTPGSGAGGGVGAATIGSVIPAPTGSRRSVEVARSKAGTPDVAGTTQPTNIPSDKATSGSSSSNSGEAEAGASRPLPFGKQLNQRPLQLFNKLKLLQLPAPVQPQGTKNHRPNPRAAHLLTSHSMIYTTFVKPGADPLKHSSRRFKTGLLICSKTWTCKS